MDFPAKTLCTKCACEKDKVFFVIILLILPHFFPFVNRNRKILSVYKLENPSGTETTLCAHLTLASIFRS